jgi:hypothetical protein
MSDKPFDPFRYNVEKVSRPVRRDLARMPIPELAPSELEPPAELKEHLVSIAREKELSSRVPAQSERRGLPGRHVSKALLFGLALVLAGLAIALALR